MSRLNLQCNYGESTIPLDKWFGSFRDGQSAKDDKISSTPGGSKEATWVTGLTCLVGAGIGLAPLVPLLQTAL
jgi:sterol desaturase/sphingolipid hydroxylase (fatty acid hydroxylase superfamily)